MNYHLLELYKDRIDNILAGMGPERADMNRSPNNFVTRIRHCQWMCDEMLMSLKGKPIEATHDSLKINRWIGFIQGVLWSEGVSTIDQLRQDVLSQK